MKSTFPNELTLEGLKLVVYFAEQSCLQGRAHSSPNTASSSVAKVMPMP